MKANMDYGELLNSMTIEDAAEVLRNTRCYGTMDIAKNVILKALEEHQHYKDLAESYEKTINKLTKAIAEQQPNEDCIRRSDIGLTDSEILMCNGDYKEALKMLLDKINKAPSVAPQPKEEPQPKTGHWVLSGGYWRCSECKEKALLKLDKATGGYREYEPVRSKYCPGCGAKMQEAK